MDLQNFIKAFSKLFENNTIEINAETEFKALDEWSSMFAQSVIIMIEDNYGVTIKAGDIRKVETIKELFDIVYEYKS